MYTPEVMEEIRLAVIDTATDMAVGQPKDLSDTPAVYQLTMRCAGKVHKSPVFEAAGADIIAGLSTNLTPLAPPRFC